MASNINGAQLEAFVEAVRELRDAEEFELLMTPGARRTFDGNMEHIQDSSDCLTIRGLLGDDLTALGSLRLDKAIDGLTARYPDVWIAGQVAA